MDIRVQERDGMKIAELIGDIDGKSAGAVLEALAPIVSAGKAMIVDMSGVEYMSSAGLRMLLTLYRQAAASKCMLVLAGLSEEIEETMDTTGFLPHFTLAVDIQTGMLAICEARAERWNGLISIPPTNTAVISCAQGDLTHLGRRSSRAGSIFRFFLAAPIIACWCCIAKGSASRWSRSRFEACSAKPVQGSRCGGNSGSATSIR